MIVVQRRFSTVMVSDTETCPTLENAMGAGGGNVPIVLIVNDQGGGIVSAGVEKKPLPLSGQNHINIFQ